ncbi:FI18412p1 [Strongyloides ratti]|uniref:FI18412p1 n=1 Tax=Strongyloides ratti TaxID=34506 RepID=A0A090KXV9_STRRB|nr:FI18412p1 [Strongyloides ratti]CEF60073.1 FI18412p1 [Strongyloides ratti]
MTNNEMSDLKKPLKGRILKWNYQFKRKFSLKNIKRGVCSIIPAFSWIPKYNLKRSLFNDLSGGLTLAVFALPQGMAHASITNLDPIYGLYTSILASFLYVFFGHSRHIALGTFAILSLVTEKAIHEAMEQHYNYTIHINTTNNSEIISSTINDINTTVSYDIINNSTDNNNLTIFDKFNNTLISTPISNIQISSTITFMVGIFHLLIALSDKEFWSCYVSEQVLSGFVVGGAVHVFFSQVSDALGISIPKRSGTGYLIYRVQDLFYKIPMIHWPTAIISLSSFFFMIFCREILNVSIIRVFRIPVPYELILIIIATTATNFANLSTRYKIKVVGMIPSKLPVPAVPNFNIIPYIILNAFMISIVSGAIHISVVKIVEKRYKCQIDGSQELRSLGLVSIISSFFPTFTVTSGFARSVFGAAANNCTQLTSFFTGTALLFLILYIAPALEYLPKSVLATMIIVAQKASIEKVKDVKQLYPIFKIDCLIFIVSFLFTIYFDMAIGLALSVTFAILTTVARSQYPRWHFMVKNMENGDFKETSKNDIQYIDEEICIIRMDGPLIFTSVQKFFKAVREALRLWEKRNLLLESRVNTHDYLNLDFTKKKIEFPLIIDCSGFPYVDYQGMCAMIRVYNELYSEGIEVYYAGARKDVSETLKNSDFLKVVPEKNIFPILNMAVNEIKTKLKIDTKDN